ncbi:hypothetical protein EC9_16840 [Rosistilla ulvae]|uniref:Alpha glucuronidase N-terminal domain-containing protein n=2 Tax=Rosistilla ulvae TaxID=1930277 RepID=A0A517LY06_9BACT|nr:hypothetical protein EC9_16840 [Rosistilla ulvae]
MLSRIFFFSPRDRGGAFDQPISRIIARLSRCAIALFALGICSGQEAVSDHPESVVITTANRVAAPVQHAIKELEDALVQSGRTIREGELQEASWDVNFVIGSPGEHQALDRMLDQYQLSVADEAESLLIAKRGHDSGCDVLLVGRDVRGTAYAVLEVAQTIASGEDDKPLSQLIVEQRESPHLAVRSVTQQMFNRELESAWYESEAFWHWYFGMMAKCRLNNFSMTFGHNTNYMIPPYAWMVKTPEYADVGVQGMTDQDRNAHLHRFRRITEIADEHGVDFTLGLWTQLPVVAVREGLDFGKSPVINLPEGGDRSKYCAVGLAELLKVCPKISGVQLRMNLESGIPHDQQETYYKTLFDGIASCGRPVKLDLRYKSLSQHTIDLARQAGLDVNVSTKHWCEHMGLPYHPTWEDRAYAASRYGFGSMLHHNRNYSVTYRLWNVGTSRLLLWGDPDFAARFAESCTLGGGRGFEVFAPLSYQGYGDAPGKWRVLADTSLEHYRWEQERYWPFYLAFGRWGYNPDTSLKVWEREFRNRYEQSTAESIGSALRSASRILPLITTTTQFSAGGFRFWPEMMTCMHLDAYRRIQPSDYSQFYAIAPFQSGNHWRGEGWASKHSSYVEDAINNNLNSKWTPIQVSQYLRQLADATDEKLDAVEDASTVRDSANPDDNELRSTVIDLRVLALLARYHADKKLAATHLEFFRQTKDPTRLKLVRRHILETQRHWQQIVALTDGQYYDDLVLGFSKEHHSDFLSRLHEHVGHWKDRLDDVQADVDYVTKLLADNKIVDEELTSQEGEAMQRYVGEVPSTTPIRFSHQRLESIRAGQAITINASVSCDKPLKQVSVYFRPLNQTMSWKRIEMERQGDSGTYQAVIPAEAINPSYDFQYYLEAKHETGGSFWPKWNLETPYVVVPVTER